MPPGNGLRIGIDRDGDGFGDGDELDGGTDPTDAGDTPTDVAPVCSTVNPVQFKTATLTDRTGRLSVRADLLLGTYTQESVAASASDNDGAIFADLVAGNLIVPKGAGFKFKAPRGSVGITDVSVREKRNSGGIFTVTLKTKGAWPVGSATKGDTNDRGHVEHRWHVLPESTRSTSADPSGLPLMRTAPPSLR